MKKIVSFFVLFSMIYELLAFSGRKESAMSIASDSTRKQYNVTVALDYHGAFSRGGGIMLGVRSQYLLINLPNFALGVGVEYHQTMGSYITENFADWSSNIATTKKMKGSNELQMIGGIFSFRYKFKGDRIQKYIESGMGFEFTPYPVYESIATSNEYNSSWYSNGNYIPYSYTTSDDVKINYTPLSSLKVAYGITAITNHNFDFFFDLGLVYYHGMYAFHRNVTQTITGGTAPPPGSSYGSYPMNYSSANNSLNVVAFNLSFGVQF